MLQARIPSLSFFTGCFVFEKHAKKSDKFLVLDTHVLAINTRDGNSTAVLVNIAGGFTKLPFTFDIGTEVSDSCSLMWNDNMYVFGGDNNKQQISRVSRCGLELISKLNFDFQSGACTATQGKILLCFSISNHEGRVCRAAKGPTGLFFKINDSNYNHYFTKIASNRGESTKHLTW